MTFSKEEFDRNAKLAIPSLFFTLCSSTGGEESEESYNIKKCFTFPNNFGKCGSAWTSAFLEQQYGNKDKNSQEDISVTQLNNLQQALRRNKFPQTPVLSSSRPIQSSTKLFMPHKQATKGHKRAVLIGIKYTNSSGSELRSSHDDTLRVAELLEKVHGFDRQDILLLLDTGDAIDNIDSLLQLNAADGDEESVSNDSNTIIAPTRHNIEEAFLHLARVSKAGDFNFISFSGHGGQVADTSGDEESGFDSSLMPVDAALNGQLLDDDLLEMLVKPMKAGVTTVALVDGCHSSNIFDLPYSISLQKRPAKQVRKKTFDMTIVSEPKRPLTQKERYLQEKAARRAKKAAEKEARKAEEARKAAEAASPTEPYVTKDAQGRTIVMGNPTPEQLERIQAQMMAEAQAAAMANMKLAPGQTVQFQMMPATGAAPGVHTTTDPQTGQTRTTVTRIVGYQ